MAQISDQVQLSLLVLNYTNSESDTVTETPTVRNHFAASPRFGYNYTIVTVDLCTRGNAPYDSSVVVVLLQLQNQITIQT